MTYSEQYNSRGDEDKSYVKRTFGIVAVRNLKGCCGINYVVGRRTYIIRGNLDEGLEDIGSLHLYCLKQAESIYFG